MMLTAMHDELKSFEELALSFSGKELAPRKEASDKYPFVPFDNSVLEKAHELGFLSMTLPEDLGGIGQGIGALCVILEGICRTDASLGTIIFANTLAQEIILKSGLLDVFRRAAPPDMLGGALIACCAYSDPREHEDLPLAAQGEKGYTLTGRVNYVVLAPIASQALIPARISGKDGYSFFLVNLPSPGVVKSEPVFSLGVHACPVADLAFDGAQAVLVGREGSGERIFAEVSSTMHAAAAAISLGIMRGSFDYALAYSNEREQGGWTIVNWSMIKTILADMAIQTKVGDMAVSSACNAIEKKVPGWDFFTKTAALYVQDAACQVTTEGIQVLGGYGYMKDYGQEKRF